MSSIIFHTDDNQAIIATDTLCTLDNGRPLRFTSKALLLPHFGLVMAGTGMAGFLEIWFIRVNGVEVVRGIDALNEQAPSLLAQLWDVFRADFSIPPDYTTTIYHFGFSERTGELRAFAYRSANGFVSEPIQRGCGRKPECALPEYCTFPDDFPKMMAEQQAIQCARPRDMRVYVGGQIQVLHLTRVGCSAYSMGRLANCDEDEKAIYRAAYPAMFVADGELLGAEAKKKRRLR